MSSSHSICHQITIFTSNQERIWEQPTMANWQNFGTEVIGFNYADRTNNWNCMFAWTAAVPISAGSLQWFKCHTPKSNETGQKLGKDLKLRLHNIKTSLVRIPDWAFIHQIVQKSKNEVSNAGCKSLVLQILTQWPESNWISVPMSEWIDEWKGNG